MNQTKKFTKNDFNDSNGMLTTVWGPPLWHFLHTMSFNYPVYPTCEDKKHYKDFIYNLTYVMPCKTCRDNLKKNLKKYPISPYLKNRYTFSKYIYNLHEILNKYLKKKSGLTYNQVRNRYEHFRARCNGTKKSHVGCAKASRAKKTKSVINIVPNSKCKTLKIDRRCFK
jgi:hypothetical protein